LCHFEKKSQAFFNILKEPLLVQKQTIHQQKAWDLSYLEPDIEKKSKFDGAKSGRKIFFFQFFFYYSYGMS